MPSLIGVRKAPLLHKPSGLVLPTLWTGQVASKGANNNSNTAYASMNITGPTNDVTHLVIAMIAMREIGTDLGLTSATIGGSAATIAANRKDTGATNPYGAAIIYREYAPSDFSDIAVALTMGGTSWDARVRMAAIADYASATHHDGKSARNAQPSVSINVPANGILLGVGAANTAYSNDWTGIDLLIDDPNSYTAGFSADATFGKSEGLALETGRTVDLAGNFDANQSMAVASFG